MPLGMLDEVDVLIAQLGGNVEAVWGVTMRMTVGLVRAAQILSTRRAREADLAMLLAAGAEVVTRGRGAIRPCMHSLSITR